ncbi:type IV secretion system protein [Paracoccus pantotrophus]|uniref:type IV secretion system protein n=1 Tax=Paracoccus pantotrophus TaxID=82367 RepID=UPI0008E963F9|nr:type IV secretion system protein [Paracoccus pantotrophus]MDF3855624.1 type IV secretion system protein [Paracoccus pantotrophus]SFP05255.1 type IV secretion system protein VirB5 [Paracoccus pantotrophus]
MNFPKIKSLLAASAVAIATGVHAQGVPTIDVTSIAKLQEMIAEARLQLDEQIAQNLKLDEQTLKMIEQIKTLHAQLDALKNGLPLADLGLDPDSFLRDILPSFSNLTASLNAAKVGNWSGALANTTSLGGSSSVSGYVDKTFETAGIKRSEVDALTNSENASAARIGNQANVNAFLSVAAESSSQAARESLTRMDGFMQQIGDTENLKQAIDLNTRVTGELGIALANIWAMEAVQTVGMGEAGIMDAATAADEEKYLTVKLEE